MDVKNERKSLADINSCGNQEDSVFAFCFGSEQKVHKGLSLKPPIAYLLASPR